MIEALALVDNAPGCWSLRYLGADVDPETFWSFKKINRLAQLSIINSHGMRSGDSLQITIRSFFWHSSEVVVLLRMDSLYLDSRTPSLTPDAGRGRPASERIPVGKKFGNHQSASLEMLGEGRILPRQPPGIPMSFHLRMCGLLRNILENFLCNFQPERRSSTSKAVSASLLCYQITYLWGKLAKGEFHMPFPHSRDRHMKLSQAGARLSNDLSCALTQPAP